MVFDADSICVAVLCGDALLAEGLKSTIHRAGMNLVGMEERPSVVVADFETALSLLSTRSGLHWQQRGLAVVVLSARSSCGEIRHAIAAGALGYLTVDCSANEPIAAIRSVHVGIRYLGVVAARSLAEEIGWEQLTAREMDVLRLLSEGHGNKVIARDLDVALGTVKSHVKAILQKLGATSRTGAAKVAERRGLLNVPVSTASNSGSQVFGALPSDARAVPALL